MRIISGKQKGILINPPNGLPVRPTTDRAKESLFNIIENRFNIEDIEVLDLFSGTGNISYEFASRGAAGIIAVDLNFKCIDFIKSMKQKHHLDMIDVVKKDVFAYLKSTVNMFDIIFADAPYAHRDIHQIPQLVNARNLLKPEGWLVVEHETMLNLDNEPRFFDKRVYGQSTFSFFK